MSADDRLAELLLEWEDQHERGQDVSAAELCHDCPELAADLQRQIEALRAMKWLTTDLTSVGVPAASEASPGVGTLLAGRYRLEAVIGEGGFAVVWRGYDQTLQRAVAVKVPKPSHRPAPQRIAGAFEEARKLARLSHPGIVAVHDVGKDAGVAFIVSDLVEGGNLAALIRKKRPSYEESARIVADLAEVLSSAHAAGIIHRDLKPANLLVGMDGRILVTDFGIALTGEESRRESAGRYGTLAYMPPEQLDGTHPPSARTDLYSLGVVFYELLAGRQPFSAPTPARLRDQIVAGAVPAPRSLDRSIPPTLERICLRCLARRPDDRYGSAGQLAQDLRAYLGRHFQPRRKRRFIVGGFLVVLLGGALAAGARNLLAPAFDLEPPATPPASDVLPARAPEGTVSHTRRNSGDFAAGFAKGERDRFPVAPSDDRTAAEWVLRVGGKVSIRLDKGGSLHRLSEMSALPPEPFKVQGVWLDENKQVTDVGLAQLQGLPELTELGLSQTALTDKGLSHLSSLKKLRRLTLAHTEITDAGLEHLGELAELEALSLAATRLRGFGLKSLGGLAKLREIWLEETQVTDGGLRHLKALKGLIHVNLSNTQVTGVCLADLSELPRLQDLRLHNTRVTDAALEHLGRVETLNRLSLSESPISDVGVAELRRLTNLTQLFVADTRVTDRGLSYLRGCTNMGILDLRQTGVTDEGLEDLGGMLRLGVLDLQDTRIDGSGLRHLRKLTGLARLNLRGTKVTDDSLIHLKALKRLRSLSLTEAPVTNAGLENLKDLVELEDLSLYGTRITDAGLRHLQNMKQLRQLNLVYTAVTDQGLEELKGLVELVEIHCTHTKVTPHGMLRLRTALPNLKP
jgi:Leucine-rich repeat (LRR) protein